MTLTFYFLQTSRAWRIAWLLEELGVEYNLQSANRQPDLSAPTSLGIPTSLGKSPAILDGSISVGESGAITELVTLACYPDFSLSTNLRNKGISVKNTTQTIA